jgi:hypothetical protein
MQVTKANTCTRCGKDRVVSKTWEEKVETMGGTSVLIHTSTVCPDPECQKIVADQFAVLKEKKDALNRNRQNGGAFHKKKNK